MKILVIIPVYNEQENIKKVISQLLEYNLDIDYLVINDCSNDDTKKILKQNNYNYVSLSANLGIGGGVQTGYIYALENNYDIAIQMDGDGQHNSEYIYNLIRPIEEQRADIVIGSRYIENEGFQSSKMRRIGITFLSKLIRIMVKTDIKDVTSGFRAVNRKVIKLFAEDYAQDYPEPESIILGAMHKMKILEIPVIMNERTGGKSSISPLKSIYYMAKVSISIVMQRVMF